jgi:DNA-binding transcriptional ArsR family regulator
MSECPIVDEDGTERCSCETNDVLRLLADTHRRKLVSRLEADGRNWIDVDSLVRAELAANEELDATTLEQELYHVHLPLLEDVGLIDYDGHSKTIRYYRCDLVSNVLDAVDVERS